MFSGIQVVCLHLVDFLYLHLVDFFSVLRAIDGGDLASFCDFLLSCAFVRFLIFQLLLFVSV